MAERSDLFDILNQAEVARGLGVTLRTMQRYESLGIGPPKLLIGKRPLYRRSSVEASLASRESHKSEPRSTRRRKGRRHAKIQKDWRP